MARRKPTEYYKQAVKVLRHGIPKVESERVIRVAKGLTKSKAIKKARARNFPVGSIAQYDPRTGILKAYDRTGKFADGFDVADGFNLRDASEWTPAQKAKVSRLFEQVNELTARPFHIYRARKPENLKIVQRASQHQTFPKELKVAFVPVSRPEETPTIKISKRTKQVKIIERQVGRIPVFWDDVGVSKEFLLSDPVAAAQILVQQVPAKSYNIMAGKHEIPQGYDEGALPEEIGKLTARYAAGTTHSRRGYLDPDNRNSSWWGNWLIGVEAYNFPTLQQRQSQKINKRKSREKLQKERKKARDAFRKKYGRGRR